MLRFEGFEEEILEKARNTYGSKNQILVCMEELNELSCVLAKYPRYEDEQLAQIELKEKAIDEATDVYIIMEHVLSIMGITQDELQARKQKKLTRLSRWLDISSSMRVTTEDREV